MTLAARSILAASFLCALVAGVRAQGGALLVVGPRSTHAGTPFQGATLYVSMNSGAATRLIRTLKGTGAGDGWGSATWSLPTNPARIGSIWYAQWLVLDGSSGRRFASSDAVAWTIF